jgi:hypothetical protein
MAAWPAATAKAWGSAAHAIHLKQLNRFRGRCTLTGAKSSGWGVLAMAPALGTDRRKLEAAVPAFAGLREWPRIAGDLGARRNRLTHRWREHAWRYFPALLETGSRLGAGWRSGPREIVLPAKAVHLREATIAKRLMRHRCRFNAYDVLAALRRPPVTMLAGSVEATAARTLIALVHLLNRQIDGAHGRLDGLTAR